MAKHSIKIQYLESVGTIDNLSFSVEPNNLSSKSLNDLSSINYHSNGFLLNSSDLSGKYGYFSSNSVKYYISSELSDENNNINIDLAITTTNAYGLSIVFSNEYYPTIIEVNGIEYTNSDNIFQVGVNNSVGVITTIKFKKMNLPNIPLIITNINTGISITYNDNYIINMERGSELSTDNSLPKYELVGQYASCSFIDYDFVVLNLKSSGILQKPKKVEFYLDDNIIGSYKVNSWEYDTVNSVVKIEFTDSISSFEQYNVNGYFTYTNDYYKYTALDLFNKIKNITQEIGETFEELSSDISNYLSSISMLYVKYDSMNLNKLWNEFCIFTQTSIFKNQKGNLEVYLWR